MPLPRVRFTVRRLMAVVAVVAAILGASTLLFDPPVTLTVINRTDRSLVNVLVTYRDGQCSVPTIAPGERTSWRFNPSYTDAVVSFDDGKGGRVLNRADVYLMPGGRGELELIVAPDGVRIGKRLSYR